MFFTFSQFCVIAGLPQTHIDALVVLPQLRGMGVRKTQNSSVRLEERRTHILRAGVGLLSNVHPTIVE